MARELYGQACQESADLPEAQRIAAEAVAFRALKCVQQDAIREFITSEFRVVESQETPQPQGRE
jgi:hypothetical protein